MNILNGHEGLVLKVVLIICVAWIICAWINAQTNRYCAIDDKDIILDKRTGAVYDPQHHELVEFSGEDKRNKEDKSAPKTAVVGGYEFVDKPETRNDLDKEFDKIYGNADEGIDLDALPTITN